MGAPASKEKIRCLEYGWLAKAKLRLALFRKTWGQ
jgi:hypothetical protein